ncbi:plasmid recombination protein [Bordetella trematum]|uniref:plasmid recombination protein n=1 Tax=Bordetella trematum TaxID=123899 RepID=UPI003988EA24
MAGYQFIHIEAYARVGSQQKDKEKKWAIRDIIAEARREPQATPHIDKPQDLDAGLVYGMPLLEVEKLAAEWGDQATDKQGRKLRKDGHCLLAGVISLPNDQKENWDSFKRQSIKWLQQQYGERLRTVVEHLDEKHPHLHFYCVAKHGERFEVLHQGQQAAQKAKEAGKVKGEQNKAYIEAMRAFQDVFSKAVAQIYGLARLGPRRRRLTRDQWKAEQKQAEMLLMTRKRASRYVEKYKERGLQESKTVCFLDKVKFFQKKPSKELEAENKQLRKDLEEVKKQQEISAMKREEAEKRAIQEIRIAQGLKQELKSSNHTDKRLISDLKKREEELLTRLQEIEDKKNDIANRQSLRL